MVNVRMEQRGWLVLHRNKFTKPTQKVNKTYILYKTKVSKNAKLGV